MGKVVTVVGVAHDDVAPGSSSNPTHQRIAITRVLHVNDASAERLCDFDGPIGAAIICDDDFAVDEGFRHSSLSFFNAHAKCFRLVQTWHDY